MPNPLRIICAWHPIYFGRRLVMQVGARDAPTSHGLCPDCEARMIADGTADIIPPPHGATP